MKLKRKKGRENEYAYEKFANEFRLFVFPHESRNCASSHSHSEYHCELIYFGHIYFHCYNDTLKAKMLASNQKQTTRNQTKFHYQFVQLFCSCVYVSVCEREMHLSLTRSVCLMQSFCVNYSKWTCLMWILNIKMSPIFERYYQTGKLIVCRKLITS